MINKKVPTISDLDCRIPRAAIRKIRPTCGPFNLSLFHAWLLSIQPSRNIGTAYKQLCWACFHHFDASITRESVPLELHRFVTFFLLVVNVGNRSICFVQNCVIMTGNNCEKIVNKYRYTGCDRKKFPLLNVDSTKSTKQV